MSTVNRELYAVLGMLRENKIRIDKPKFKPGKKTEQRDFTEEEVKRFIAVCDDDQKTLFLFLLATGARPAEVLPSSRSTHVALLKSELNSEACKVSIRTAKLKPGQKAPRIRVIPIPKELMLRVTDLAKRTDGKQVFAMNQSLSKLFDRILERAGIAKIDDLGRKLTAHSFRHTYASMMARRLSDNPFALKAILGHCQISTTDRYVHARGKAEVVEVAQFLPSIEPHGEVVDKLGVMAGGKQKAPAVAEAS